MTIDRRTLMLGSAGAMLGSAGALALTAIGTPRLVGTAHAAMPAQQIVGAQRRKVGDAVVTAISDGYIQLGADAIPNGEPEDLKPYFDSAFMDLSNFKAACNAYLVDTADRRVLIDAGGEMAGFPTLGHLDENLMAIGVEPGSIDALVVTHLHPDHVGGAFKQDGSAAFPNAEMVVRAEEYAFWHDDANMNDGNKAFFELARKAVAAYEKPGKLTRYEKDVEVLPGLTAVFLPGHTPGHTGYRLDGGDEQLLIWGDIVHMAPVQFAAPQYYIGFDVNPDQAVQTRQKIMDMASADRTKIAGMHLLFPGFGNVAKGKGEEAYRFVDAPYDYDFQEG